MSNREEPVHVDRRIAMKYLGVAGVSLLLAGCEVGQAIDRSANPYRHAVIPDTPRDKLEGHGGR